MALDSFSLDAEITVSELRREDVVAARLRAHHRLRLRRKNDLLGVLVDAGEWRHIVEYVRDLEHLIARYEDESLRNLVTQRAANANFEPATPEAIADIERLYEERIDAS